MQIETNRTSQDHSSVQPALTSLADAIEVLITNKEWRLAQKLLVKLTIDQPNSNDHLFALARCFIGMGQKHAAIKTLTALAKLDDSERTYRILGDLYLGDNQLDAALTCYLDALLRAPHDDRNLYNIYKNVGNIYLKQKNIEMAEDFYNKAFTIHPNSDVLAVNYGTLLIQQGEWMMALEKYRRALYINPRNDQAWTGMAIVHNQLGEIDLAWAHLKRALDLQPHQVCALQLAANWSLRAGNSDQVIDWLKEALDQEEQTAEKTNWDLSFIFIELCAQTQRLGLAQLEVEKLSLFFPKDERLKSWGENLRKHIGAH